jgi:hypothetical protein
MLAALAMAASVMPARADVVFEYRIVPTITTQTEGAPVPVGGLQLVAGGPDVFLQIVLHDTGSPNPPSATNPVFQDYTGGQGGSGNGNQLTAWGFRINYPTNGGGQQIAFHVPPIDQQVPGGNLNTRATMTAYGFGAAAAPATAQGPGFSYLNSLTLGDGAYNPLTYDPIGGNPIPTGNAGIYPLVNIRIRPDATNVGSGAFSIVDHAGPPSDDIGTNNNPSFDQGIFDQPFLLPVTVTGVPEPSSMVLVGLAVAGLGYRARRKKAAEQAV